MTRAPRRSAPRDGRWPGQVETPFAAASAWWGGAVGGPTWSSVSSVHIAPRSSQRPQPDAADQPCVRFWVKVPDVSQT